MIKIEAQNIKKYYGDRLILDMENLKIYDKDRIGIVGLNGSGKTTLMDILSKAKAPDKGVVNIYGNHSYITQLDGPMGVQCNSKIGSLFDINNISTKNVQHLSGGEKTKLKIAQNIDNQGDILFADEPTSNLDMKSIKALEEILESFDGCLVLISHDRQLLDSLCNKILEIENGKVKEYSGNYSDYKHQKQMELDRQNFEYDQFSKERQKLEKAIFELNNKASRMKKTPTRMGNSEARLHKRSTTGKQAKIHQATNALKSRIQKLDKKEKPKKLARTQFDIPSLEYLQSKFVIRGNMISKSFGDRVLLKNIDFEVRNGDKVALIGDNGTGKTTLINMIMSKDENIKIAPKAKIAYFSQELEILNDQDTILESVMKESIHDATFVRTLLARLLFTRDDVYKKIKFLSGGERVKVAFAKIFLQDMNLVILDEPTNYLDIHSIEALEHVLEDYPGTLLLTSHDRRFIDKVTNKLFILENQSLTIYNGTYGSYLANKENVVEEGTEELHRNLLLLQNKLSEISSRLSIPSKDEDIEALDREFNSVVKEINDLKKLLYK